MSNRWLFCMMLALPFTVVIGAMVLRYADSPGIDRKQVQLKGSETVIVGKMIQNVKGEHLFFLLLMEGKEQLTFQVDEKLYFHSKVKSKAVLSNRADGSRMIAGIVEE